MKKLLFVAAAVVAMSSASTMFTSCKKNIVDTDPKTVITDSTAGDSLNADSITAEATDAAKPEAGTEAADKTADKAPAADATETPAEPAK